MASGQYYLTRRRCFGFVVEMPYYFIVLVIIGVGVGGQMGYYVVICFVILQCLIIQSYRFDYGR